ncbi:DUF624 domain-containing protein [Raineyella sp.]|uniref:DUF624 domain-containing protein n=1 Tax=Raineyella sp. TaxID=1911550 RepID=UPI002B219168|nr:DUF624 domain-containing protein [Raineyella sp.]MEA5154737.1 DUF624 domain-containing protein [Raineyella sp.]
MFRGLFDLDTPLWHALGRVADIVLLNLLALLTSIPLVTVGASLTALYDCARRIQSDTGGGTTAMYFTSFRSNLGRSTVLLAVLAPLGAALARSWMVAPVPGLLPARIGLSLAYLLVFPYVWALQARFDNPPWRTLRNAVVLAFARLPLSLAVLGIHLALGTLVVLVALHLPQGLFLLVLLGYPLAVFAVTPLLERALAPLLTQGVDTATTSSVERNTWG